MRHASAVYVFWLLGVLLSCPLAAAGELTPDDFSPDNVFDLPHEAIPNQGSLILGGSGDLPDEIYHEFVRLAGGTSAHLVLIPSAYPFDDWDQIRKEFAHWEEYKVASFEFLHTDDPDEADSEEFLAPLRDATGVWIEGGAQQRLTYRYGGREVESLLKEIVSRGGVVGGTSAGASVLSRNMIVHGSATQAVVDRGLGLTGRLIIDQHFSERGRYPRLLGALEAHRGHIGIGVDERTAAVVQANQVHVLGEGTVAFFVGPTEPGDATAVYRLQPAETAETVVVPRCAEGGVTFNLRKIE